MVLIDWSGRFTVMLTKSTPGLLQAADTARLSKATSSGVRPDPEVVSADMSARSGNVETAARPRLPRDIQLTEHVIGRRHAAGARQRPDQQYASTDRTPHRCRWGGLRVGGLRVGGRWDRFLDPGGLDPHHSAA